MEYFWAFSLLFRIITRKRFCVRQLTDDKRFSRNVGGRLNFLSSKNETQKRFLKTNPKTHGVFLGVFFTFPDYNKKTLLCPSADGRQKVFP